MSKWIAFYLLVMVSPVAAQFTYQVDQEAEVIEDGKALSRAWAGGLNAPQYSTMDLNDDGQEDLVVFDRVSSKITPFLAIDNDYKYAPEYEAYFPANIRNWMLLRDFNCDGKKDIFASDPLGVIVYVNTTEDNGPLSWRVFNKRGDKDYLLSQGFTSQINLQVNARDLPAVSDIDGDGDLDILDFKFTGASTVEYHKNLSMERDGNCDSLQYERVTQTWGDFVECICGTFAFNGNDCEPISGGRVEHTGGKSVLILDLDGNGVKDLIMSEEKCTALYALTNTGTVNDAAITAVSGFPANDPIVSMLFPAAYHEDVDFDGVKDLLIAPNVSANVSSAVNFQSSGYFYKNTGSNTNLAFQKVQQDFLQDEMIEVGENAAPAFADIDDDGDLDMILGSYINYEEFGFRSSLVLYRNDGTPGDPSFVKETSDYLSLSLFNIINIKPRFRDVNADGKTDLVFSATELNTGITNIYYFLNQSEGAFNFDFQQRQLFSLGNSFPNNDNYDLFDIDSDGLLDLLVGKSSGRLEYYRNIGSAESPAFELYDETFYGLDYSPYRQSPSISIDDFNGDGKTDLLIGDSGGNLNMYPDFLSTLDDPQPSINKLFMNPTTGDSLALSLGNRLLPTAVNLYNEDKPVIAIGTGTGGILLLRNINTSQNPLPADGLAVYPNPVSQNQYLKIGADKSMVVAIVSLTGQTIFNNISIKANRTVNINISKLEEGMYIVIGRSANGRVAKRFIVVK